MEDKDIDVQLVPPHLHRRNASERAISTFKDNFIAGLCRTDPDFPLHLWDKLLPQAVLSLNLLRGSRINPRLSAYAQIYGAFDFNRTPLAPPGTRVLIHEKPAVRETWAPHAVDGWYIGPAMNHYRCFRVWACETAAQRVADTLSWFPSRVLMPTASATNTITAALQDLISAIKAPTTTATALSPFAHAQHDNLLALAELFTACAAPPTPSTPPGFVPIPPPPTEITAGIQRVEPPYISELPLSPQSPQPPIAAPPRVEPPNLPRPSATTAAIPRVELAPNSAAPHTGTRPPTSQSAPHGAVTFSTNTDERCFNPAYPPSKLPAESSQKHTSFPTTT